MREGEKKVLVVDHRIVSEFDMVDQVREVAKGIDHLLVLYSGYVDKNMVDEIPDNVVVEFVNRGLLPSSIVKPTLPITRFIKVGFRYTFKRMRKVRFKIGRVYRLAKWWGRRLIALRSHYLRKFLSKFISAIMLFTRFCVKAMRKLAKLAYSASKPQIKTLSSIFVEWPIAITLSLFTVFVSAFSALFGVFAFIPRLFSWQAKRKTANADHVGIVRQLMEKYYQLTQPYFEQRLDGYSGTRDRVDADYLQANTRNEVG